jgi:hypothetical protein
MYWTGFFLDAHHSFKSSGVFVAEREQKKERHVKAYASERERRCA